MIVDSSALAAIIFGEPDAGMYRHALRAHQPVEISAATWLEVAMVLEARAGREAVDTLDAILREYGIEVLPVTTRQAQLALDAFRRFGKGRGTKAQLNFGDCLAYALATSRSAPLLFKGDDFGHTDITPALR